MSLFGKKKSKSSSTSVSTTPAWHQQILQDIANKAVSLSNQPYQAYTGNRVADFTSDQQKSFDMTRNNAGVWQPNLNMADSLTAGSGSPFSNSEMMQYLSPYLGGVVDEIGRVGSRNLTERLLPGVNDTFTGSGQFGSSRHADFTNQAVRDVNESIMGQQRQALQSGYDSAMQGYFTGRDQQARAGAQLGQLGQARSALGYQDAQAMNAIGGQQQARNQALSDVDYQNYLEARDDPYKKAAWEAQMISGLPVTQTNTTNSQSSQSSGGVLGQVLGGLGMAASMFTGGSGGLGALFGGGSNNSGASMFSAPIAASGVNTGMNAASMMFPQYSPYHYRKGGLVKVEKHKKISTPFRDIDLAEYSQIDNIDPIGSTDVSRPVRARIKGVKIGRPKKYAEGGKVDELTPIYGSFDEGLEEDQNDPGLPVNFQINGAQAMPNGSDQSGMEESLRMIKSLFGNNGPKASNPTLSADNILTTGELPGRAENIRSSQDAFEAALKNLQGSAKPKEDWINLPLFVGSAALAASDGNLGQAFGEAGLAAANVIQGQRGREQDLDAATAKNAAEVAADNYRAAMKSPNFEDIYTPQGGKQKIYTSPDGHVYQVGGVNFPDAPQGFIRGPDGSLQIDPQQLEAQILLRNAGRSNNSVNVNTGGPVQSAADAAYGKGKGEMYINMQKEADDAAKNRQDLLTLRGLLNNSDMTQGNLTGLKSGLGRFLSSVGMAQNNIDGLLGNVSDIDAFNKIAGQQVMQILGPLKGATSDRDLVWAKEQAVNPNFTKEGNAKMLNIALRAIDNSQKISNLISTWQSTYGFNGRDSKGRTLDQAIDMTRNPDKYRSAEDNKYFVEMSNGDQIDVRRITPAWIEKNAPRIKQNEMQAIYQAAPKEVREYLKNLIQQPTVNGSNRETEPQQPILYDELKRIHGGQ